MSWVAHLEYLQPVLKKFNLIAASNKDILIWYFQYGLHPSIWVQMDEQDCNLRNWNKAIKKTIDIKSKASRQPLSEI